MSKQGALLQTFASAAPAAQQIAKPKPPVPFSLRLSREERALLERSAGSQPLGAYIRSRLFREKAAPRKARRSPVADHEALARVLARLGQSGLTRSMNDIAEAIRCGSLEFSPETEARIHGACSELSAIRRDMIRALGIAPE